MKGIIPIVHAVLAVFLIIELGLTGYVVDATNGHGRWHWVDTPSSFAFMLFCAVWSILMLIYLALIPLFAARFYHGLAGLVILAITTLIWFAGSIAMAAKVGSPDCGGNTLCQSIKAAIAFGFFIWAIFTGLTVMEGLGFMRSRGGHGARADAAHSKPGGVV